MWGGGPGTEAERSPEGAGVRKLKMNVLNVKLRRPGFSAVLLEIYGEYEQGSDSHLERSFWKPM